MSKEARGEHEADLPAEQSCAQAPTRLPRTHGHHGRAQGADAPSGQGQEAPVGVNRPNIEGLRKRAQFLFVRAGARAARPHVVVEARRRAPDGAIGVGFTASRKVGGAVIRNRARRRLREAARQLLPVHGVAGVDYVMVARANTAQAPWGALLDDVQNALIRLAADLSRPEQAARRSARAKRPSGPASSRSPEQGATQAKPEESS